MLSPYGTCLAYSSLRKHPFLHMYLFAACGRFATRGTSATQGQKFHTDDVKSVRNPVINADWTTD